jgi:hypothetical protein
MNLRWIVGATLIGCAAGAAAQGPVSSYYLIAGDQRTDWRVQGTNVLNSWSQVVDTEYPVAINGGIVKTTGVGQGLTGAGYSLSGTDTGSRYTNPAPVGMYDGASDGTHNFGVDYSSGDVYQFDANWGSPTVLFGGLGGGNYLGITYDPTNNSLWISRWNSTTVEDRSLGGTVLSSFNLPFASISCLAMDYADNTLWMGSQNTFGTFYHYSRAGASLGQVTYASMTAQNTLGGEFAPVPEPASLAVVGLGLLALRRRRQRKA